MGLTDSRQSHPEDSNWVDQDPIVSMRQLQTSGYTERATQEEVVLDTKYEYNLPEEGKGAK